MVPLSISLDRNISGKVYKTSPSVRFATVCETAIISPFRLIFNKICPERTMNFKREYRWIDSHEKIIKYAYSVTV